MSDEEVVIKQYKVRVTVEWEVEVEADDANEAEYLAEEYVQGSYSWEIEPEYVSTWATEVTP